MAPSPSPQIARIFILCVLVTVGLVGALVWSITREPVRGGDFTLVHRGAAWTYSQNSKPLTLLYVGYAKCPDVCPMSLSSAGQAFRALSPAELQKIQLVFLSVDYEHDTPESVADYAINFDPSFTGLTGSKEQIDQAARMFGASYVSEPNPGSYLGYSIAHSDRMFFLNSKGHLIDSLANPHSSDLILAKIKEHL